MRQNDCTTNPARLFHRNATPFALTRHPGQVRVKVLSERARPKILKHFLGLDAVSRRLRFGNALGDDLVTRYVDGIDFGRDTVFGVYDWRLKLGGVGHLAFSPMHATSEDGGESQTRQIAEFGLSVSVSARGKGIGTKLFERAAMHCRNAAIDTLTMHCLAENRVMMHIAVKSGMKIHRDRSDANAWLKLPPADPVSVLKEAIEEQAATIDYTMKANRRAATKWLESLMAGWWCR